MRLRLLSLSSLGVFLACATGPRDHGDKRDELVIRGQPVPVHALTPSLEDFDAPADWVVLHYYGSGGWGIRWGRTYLLTAPYFSNHDLLALAASAAPELPNPLPRERIVPKVDEVRAGFAGTPVGDTAAILIGHGHVDHAGDVPAFFGAGLITGKPALIADRSTVNELAALAPQFGCIAPIDGWDSETAPAACPIPGVRITALHHAHAPHLNLAGVDVAAYGSRVRAPRTDLPSRAADYKLGNTWAFLIDLLDAQGRVAFRIHYVDAAAGPPHAIIPARLLAERDVDVHIACVPGFEQTDDYPDAVLEHHHTRYVLLGHWEDFFQPRSAPLKPVRNVLSAAAIERFIAIVEKKAPHARGVAPSNKSAADCTAPKECGPRGETWALPVPGETYRFETRLTAPAGP